MNRIKETWRGWQGHFCGACRWHLNTLLDLDGKKIVVSTVGMLPSPIPTGRQRLETLSTDGRLYETMVFESLYDCWDDADVEKELAQFSRGYKLEEDAQSGHYEVLDEVKEWLLESKHQLTERVGING